MGEFFKTAITYIGVILVCFWVMDFAAAIRDILQEKAREMRLKNEGTERIAEMCKKSVQS